MAISAGYRKSMEEKQDELIEDLVKEDQVQLVKFFIKRERERISWTRYSDFQVNDHKSKVVYSEDRTKGIVTEVNGAWEKLGRKKEIPTSFEDLKEVPDRIEIAGSEFNGEYVFSILEELLNKGIYHLNGSSLYKKYKENPFKLIDLLNSLTLYKLKGKDHTVILFWNKLKGIGIMLAPLAD